MLSLLATWDELDRFEEEWDRALLKLSDAAREAVRAATVEAPAEGINTRKYKDQTGLLTSRITGFVEVSVPGGAIGEVGAYTYYASFVDGGTQPHEIWATAGSGFKGPLRNGQSRGGRGTHSGGLLTFKTADGQWRSVPMVNHPGTKADGFAGRMYGKAEAVMIREVEIGIDQLQRFLED